jgi:antitoxin HicB
MEYSVVLIPEPEGGFTITIPAFPEYVGYARTEEEARTLVQEGISFELERLREAGQPAPDDLPLPRVLRIPA